MRSVRFRRTSLCIPLTQLSTFSALTQAEPPQATTQSTGRPRLSKGAFGLQKSCEVVDGSEGCWMMHAQLTLSPVQGPTKKVLCLAQDAVIGNLCGAMCWMDGAGVCLIDPVSKMPVVQSLKPQFCSA